VKSLAAAYAALAQPGAVLRGLLPSVFAIFFVTHLFASLSFYSGKPFHLKDAVISDIESREDNPRGYLVAAAGTAVCGILLFPLSTLLHRRLRAIHRPIALAGSVILRAGLTCAVAVGAFAPFPFEYGIHIALAFATFICITAGLLVSLVLVVAQAFRDRKRWARGLFLLALLESAALVFEIYLIFAPDHFFPGTSFMTSLAGCEWALCVFIAACSYVVAAAVARAC
jgi:hypothetical protein